MNIMQSFSKRNLLVPQRAQMSFLEFSCCERFISNLFGQLQADTFFFGDLHSHWSCEGGTAEACLSLAWKPVIVGQTFQAQMFYNFALPHRKHDCVYDLLSSNLATLLSAQHLGANMDNQGPLRTGTWPSSWNMPRRKHVVCARIQHDVMSNMKHVMCKHTLCHCRRRNIHVEPDKTWTFPSRTLMQHLDEPERYPNLTGEPLYATWNALLRQMWSLFLKHFPCPMFHPAVAACVATRWNSRLP